TAACAVHAGALPRSATAWLLAPVAVATPPAATTAARPHEAMAPRTNKRLPTRSPTPETLTLLAGAGRLLYPRARHLSLDGGGRASELRGLLEPDRRTRAGDRGERVDDGRIEVRPGAAVELGDRCLVGHRLPVAAVGR